MATKFEGSGRQSSAGSSPVQSPTHGETHRAEIVDAMVVDTKLGRWRRCLLSLRSVMEDATDAKGTARFYTATRFRVQGIAESVVRRTGTLTTREWRIPLRCARRNRSISSACYERITRGRRHYSIGPTGQAQEAAPKPSVRGETNGARERAVGPQPSPCG
jgi:hypothetical protein